jgi:muconolactone delta-isomerase
MKFLIIQKARQTPVETWARLLPAHFKYLDDLEKKGTLEVSYHLVGEQADLLVVNVKSDEELGEIISEDPLFFHSDRKVHPLTTREAHKKRLRKMLGKR